MQLFTKDAVQRRVRRTQAWGMSVAGKGYDALAELLLPLYGNPRGLLGWFVGWRMGKDHAALWEWGMRDVQLDKGMQVLDIGCGNGMLMRFLFDRVRQIRISGVDHSQAMVQMAQQVNEDDIDRGAAGVLRSEVSDLPFPAGIFDLATAFETVYFWPDLVNDLKEVRRVLKPGGRLLVVNEVYRDPQFEERNARWAGLSGMKYHTPEEYRDFITQAGFSSVETVVDAPRNWLKVTAVK